MILPGVANLWHDNGMARTTEKGKRRIKKKTRGRDALRMATKTTKYFSANTLKEDKKVPKS